VTARKRVKPRNPGRAPVQNLNGQYVIDTDQPWQDSACTCWPPNLRGCGHCKPCDTCEDCKRCAGRGCVCACEETT
jgi:hypothetical protein